MVPRKPIGGGRLKSNTVLGPNDLALLLTLLLAFIVSGFHYWSYSYWGGSVAGLFGALVLGASLKIARSKEWSFSYGLLFAFSGICLGNARPFEGLVFYLGCFSVLILPRIWKEWNQTRLWLKFGLPCVLVYGLGLGLMLDYNVRTTGDPLKMPYMLHTEQYSNRGGQFLSDGEKFEKEYRHPQMARVYAENESPTRRGDPSIVGLLWNRISFTSKELTGFWFWVLVIGSFVASREWRIGVIVVVAGGMAILAPYSFHPHYVAPFFPAVLLLIGLGANRLWPLLSSQRRLAGVLLMALALLPLVSEIIQNQLRGVLADNGSLSFVEFRKYITDGIGGIEGDDLVFVRYHPEAKLHDEFVYNEADIDESSIVWARFMSFEENQELIDYYGGSRLVWLLEAAGKNSQIIPYPENPSDSINSETRLTRISDGASPVGS